MHFLLLSVALATPPIPIGALLDKMASAEAALRDATYTVERSEWTGGRQLPTQEIAVRYRRPEELLLRWANTYPGRAVLYRQGWNDGRLRVRPASMIPLLNLDPLGSLAMRDARHPVWMVSLSRVVGRILKATRLLTARPELVARYTDEGEQDVGGTPSRCYSAVLPYAEEPGVYAPRVRICAGIDSHLPTRFSAWKAEDGQVRQVEDYVFRDLTVNPGLSDADFDTAGL
ncbi:MAG: hypothetical protein ACI8S6_000912 [Myxococcota bacterium]|jgi:hypothetical protein